MGKIVHWSKKISTLVMRWLGGIMVEHLTYDQQIMDLAVCRVSVVSTWMGDYGQ